MDMTWKRGIHYTKNTLIINSFIEWPCRKGDKGGNGFRVRYISLCHGLRQFIRQTPLPPNSQQGTRTKQNETRGVHKQSNSPWSICSMPSKRTSLLVETAPSTMTDGTGSGLECRQHLEPGTWAAAGTGNRRRVKLWCHFSCFFFSWLDPVGVGCTEFFLCCGRKEADVLGTVAIRSHLQNLPWNSLSIRNPFPWRPEASKKPREKLKKTSALARWRNSFSNLARMKRERSSA